MILTVVVRSQVRCDQCLSAYNEDRRARKEAERNDVA